MCIRDSLIWELLLSDVYHLQRDFRRGKQETVELGCDILRKDLMSWYGEMRKKGVSNLVEMQDLRPSMIGTDAHRDVRAKAGELKWLLVFLETQTHRFASTLACAHTWQKLTGALTRLLELLSTKDMGLVLTTEVRQDRSCHSFASCKSS